MARIPDPMLAPDPQVRELYDRLAAKRGVVDGMYRSMLNYPELCQHVSDLGTFLRFGSATLTADVRELVILWLARNVGAAYEWVKHEPLALRAGISAEVIEAIRCEQPVSGLSPIQAGALTVARSVLDRRSIPESVQDALAAKIGLKGVIELVVLIGFYQMIAAVIFAFEVPLPEGETAPF